MLARGDAGDPLRFVWRPRQPSIEAHAALRDDERLPGLDPFAEWFIQRGAFVCEHARTDGDAGLPQSIDAATVMPGVQIDRADYNVPDAGLDDRARTRRRATGGGTRLERHVKHGLFGKSSVDFSQTIEFRVRTPWAPMEASRDDFPVDLQERADGGVRTCEPQPLPGLSKRRFHHSLVDGLRHYREVRASSATSNCAYRSLVRLGHERLRKTDPPPAAFVGGIVRHNNTGCPARCNQQRFLNV